MLIVRLSTKCLTTRARDFAPTLRALFDDVIDPVQPEKADEDQIDSHGEAHGPRREHQERSRDQGSDWQKVVGSGVHLEFIADSDGSPARHTSRR
jgi:hypothetical protein